MRHEIYVRREPFLMNRFDFLLVGRCGDGAVAEAKPVMFERVDPEKVPVERPMTFSLQPDEAQALMDELYRAGLRPTEGAGSPGQVAAMSRHLEDMRALVFKLEAKA